MGCLDRGKKELLQEISVPGRVRRRSHQLVRSLCAQMGRSEVFDAERVGPHPREMVFKGSETGFAGREENAWDAFHWRLTRAME